MRLDEVLQDMDISDGIYDATNQYDLENSERIGFEDLIAEPEPIRRHNPTSPQKVNHQACNGCNGAYSAYRRRLHQLAISNAPHRRTNHRTDHAEENRSDIARALSPRRIPVSRPRGCTGTGGGRNLRPPD